MAGVVVVRVVVNGERATRAKKNMKMNETNLTFMKEQGIMCNK